ncbi:hypothetical protein BIY23_04310 [Wolbachia pipientis]|uniref:OTU domain-containing protein n=1 Tax=Wolbachia pipientis TaxID=955 RepID=A0A1E7QJK3_WOLPI|nr:hypothetical protein [Wolbachia pipientis]OEY86419.1 hypothetical protein BIY23_04310 [Wolbachia pipientis]
MASNNQNKSTTTVSEEAISYPNNFYQGTAPKDHSCFFHSFQQSLEQQRGIKVSAKQLRKDCADFANSVSVPDWFKNAINASYELRHNNQTEKHEEVLRKETIDQYKEKIMQDYRWGDPDIEGKILCKKYNVKLHIIEKNPLCTTSSDQPQFLHQLIDADKNCNVDASDSTGLYNGIYSDSSIIHIINMGNNHFDPVLDKNLLEPVLNKNLQEQQDYELAKNLQIEEDLEGVKYLQNEELQISQDFELARNLQIEEIATYIKNTQSIDPLKDFVRKVIEIFNKLIQQNDRGNIQNVVDECVRHFDRQQVLIDKQQSPSCKMEEVKLTCCTPSHGISCA